MVVFAVTAIDCELRKGAVELYKLEDSLLFAFWSNNSAAFGVLHKKLLFTYYHVQCISLPL